MAAELILMLDEPLAADEEEMLIDSDDEEEICVKAATSIFMRRDLSRNYGFCDVIVPTYSKDEFKSHFRMTRGTLDILCRDGSKRNNPTGKPLWKTTYTCPVPSVGICLVYVQF